jgi:hypothetical protein
MKTTIESYQNQTKNLQDLTNLQLDDLYLTVYDSIGEAIENDNLELHDKILPILRAIKKEIQDRNEVTLTIKQTIKTQINQIIKKRNRNTSTLKYAFFLNTIKKITTKKLSIIAFKMKDKKDTLKRVHTLLVYEHNRLNKVA